jgi:hypothetical protein
MVDLGSEGGQGRVDAFGGEHTGAGGGLHVPELGEVVAGEVDVAVGAERAFQGRLQTVAAGSRVHVAELPAVHGGAGDRAARLGIEVVQVAEEALRDRLVALPHQRRGGRAAGEQHQAAPGAAVRPVAEHVGLVREHVERQAGGRHRVDVVVGHRAALARLDRDAQEGAVGELRERRAGLAGDGRDQRRGERRLRGDDGVARADRLGFAVLDDQGVAVGAQRAHTAAGAGALAELATQRGGQPARAAPEVARGQRALAAPHEREKADATARRQLRRLGRGATGGAGEDGLDGGRQRAEEVREAPIALEGEHTRARVARRVARSGPGDTAVAGHRALDLEPGVRERDALAERQREPQRIGLHATAVEQLRPERQPHHAAGDRHGLEAALADHRVDHRPGRGE